MEIRIDKLPDPSKIGNAGSFFKNPIITTREYNLLKKRVQDLKGFKTSEGIKISAAYLIEKTGFKGLKKNNFGVHSKQALVLVNYSDAKGDDILSFSKEITQKIWEKFGISLQREVNVV